MDADSPKPPDPTTLQNLPQLAAAVHHTKRLTAEDMG